MQTVITFWAFDLVHEGHIYYLSEAKKYGTRLVTVVARDSTIEKIKWKKPKFKQEQRIKDIKALNIADIVELGDENDMMWWIKKYKPDTIAIGYDQTSFIHELSEYLMNNNIKSKVLTIKPYKEDIYKSSKIKKELK